MPDVFPRRNLSPDSEAWGREVERRIVAAEGVADASRSGVSAQNRTIASSLGDATRQLERIEALFQATPKPAQRSYVNTGFGLTGGWQTIASVTVPAPDGSTNAEVFATGSGFLSYTSGSLIAGSMRLVANGSASPSQPWSTFSDSGGFRASITPSYSWSVSLTPGQAVTVNLQVNPANAGTWGANTANYAAIVALATFTG